ncbi:MAG TPA: tetratricopeptide repeat protein [Xanthomonadales bacterium]|nr:tetratricopeptide repeat protein [Xanthomonadales bacterium]
MGEPEEPATGVASTRVGVASLPSYISGAPRPDPLSIGPAAWVGRQIDDYRILRVIGAGGMGVVFLAQQRHPKRMVAIKTLHAGLHQADLLARFQQEAEILGRLKHPGIAQIYASGRTDASLGSVPYIVMEFVEGAPLLEFCNKLDMRERLQLLMRVCDAVEHAHIRGVIHRDLKPGNILVQADGLPKVLDFGVARLTGEEHAPSELTSVGMVIGTVAFMSPEQALGEPGGVDIRTDVYALGMIGYRMLSGEMPYEVTSHNLGRALQQICESAPTPLSRHDRRYAGDLETIFHKVLAKDKDARYQNAAELAEDLRRYLADESILARRASVFSEVRRFARRNKILVAAAAMVLLSLVGAVMVSTRFALDEQAQRLQADAVINSMRRMLSGANPVFAQGEDVTLRAWIEQGEQQLQRDLSNAPAARGRIRFTLAETFKMLGGLDRALTYYTAARTDFLEAGVSGLELELVTVGAARVLLDSGRVREARQQLDELLANSGDQASPARVMARLHLAVALATLGENAAANEDFSRGFDALSRSAATPCEPCMPQWAVRLEVWARARQSVLQIDIGELEAALLSANQAMALAHNALRADDPDTQVAVVHVSMAQQASGRNKEAIALLQEALAERRKVLKDNHWQTIATADNLAFALGGDGQFEPAEAMYRHWLLIAEQSLDAQHPELATIKANLGNLLFDRGRLDEAVALLADAYARRVNRLGSAHPSTLTTARNLAVMYTAQAKTNPARFDDAERLMRAALDGTVARFGVDHRQTIDVRSEYASVLRDRGRYVEADREFDQAWALAERLLAPGDNDRLRVLFQYSGSLQRQQRFAEAEVLSSKLIAEVELAADRSAGHARMAPLRHARSLIGLKRFDEAEKLLLELDAGPDAKADPALRKSTHATLVELYQASGQPEKAKPYQ